ncbi:GGDEF domain-containing protein [Edaphobacter bradus]|uniref:GGDEF domain-containing protein n=1 Tax=Edaphobacter bradus TaxID=2259016 RepID=UPI0021DFB990|nr:GGDEF domain-containing protein [Edaphobacter bradus]
MDTQTLVIANALLFALYAGVMLVNARVVGGTRGAMCFAASSLCCGAAMLLVGVQWLRIAPVGLVQAVTAILAVLGLILLHQSFAELLDRGPILRWVQSGTVGLVHVIAGLLILVPSMAPKLEAVLYVMLGLQLAAISAVVLRFSAEDTRLAGWLTGLALSAFAVIQFVRADVMTRYGTPAYAIQSQQINQIWLVGGLITNAAVAFGFMALSTARLRADLLWRAQVDELSGLLNRWALKRFATQEIQRCKRSRGTLAMMMMDLDGLKEVNDSRGHACGDVVLQAVAGVLQETVRAQDSVGRIGGDEFCVLLPETTLDEAMAVAERLRERVEMLVIQYLGDTVRVSMSVGVTSSDVSGLVWQALVDHSDSALYSAKRNGRNKVVAAAMRDLPIRPYGERGESVMAARRSS